MSEKLNTAPALCIHCGAELKQPGKQSPQSGRVFCRACGRYQPDKAPEAPQSAPESLTPSRQPGKAIVWSPNVCWFCENRLAKARVSIELTLYGYARSNKTSTGFNGQLMTVRVPRCGHCKTVHDLEYLFHSLVFALGGLLILAGWAAPRIPPGWTTNTLAIAAGVLCIVLGSSLFYQLHRRLKAGCEETKPLETLNLYPAVKALEQRGWSTHYQVPSFYRNWLRW